MKIDGNSQVLRSVRLERAMQENSVGQTAAPENSQGAAFEKNRNDLFVEQLERVQNGENKDIDALEDPGRSAKSKLEILSNLVTERDLEEFKEQRGDLEEENLEVVISVVEKIKVQLATYCDDFDAGMVEDISGEKLEKLSGIAGNALHIAKKLKENNLPVTEENVMGVLSALEMVEKTGMLTEDAKEYCIKTEMDLTIENLYMAAHSGAYEGGAGYYAEANGYYAKAGDGSPIEELLPQMERIIAQSGLESNEATLAQAQWLVEKQLPLTEENLLKLQELEEISNKMNEDGQDTALEHMVDALLEGKRPSQAVLAGESVLERGEHAVSVIQNATEEQVREAAASGQEVTIANLEAAGKGDSAVQQSEVSAAYQEETDIQLVTARRQLEEIRLRMTIEASVTMIRHGVSIETESLQNLIERLKQIEDQYYEQLLAGGNVEPTAANIDLFKEIAAVREGISQSPADLIGSVAFARTRVTMQVMYTEGTALEEKYRHANQAYETLMTRPRSDMGDSIQKAFRNVDDILEDMGLEITRENQRAVRILGYNSLEITEGNIQKVKEADIEVMSMIANMKPGTVLNMIREGYNPLDQTAGEINDKIASMREQTTVREENYSEFLWNLEHSEGISKEERSAFIGIYRLMHQIERSDGAVVGALVEQGLSLTMRNLMTGIRSGRHKAMDYKIGESGGVEGTKSGSITEQIEAGFGYEGRLAEQIQNQMATADWNDMPENAMDMSMEEFADYVFEHQKEKQMADGYAREQLDILNRASQTEEEVLSFLQAKGQPVTIGNILASAGLLKSRGSLFGSLKEYAKAEDDILEQELSERMDEVEHAFTDKESAKEAYGKLVDTAKQVINQGIEDTQITYERMRSWKLISSQVHLASRLSESEDYHIPLEINGEWTAVHVQFVHNTAKQAKVSISFETVQTGKIAAEFTERKGTLEGYVMTEKRQAREQFAMLDNQFREQIQKASGLHIGKMDYAEHGRLNLSEFAADAANETAGSASGSDLYQVAKSVLGFVKTAFA